MARDAKPLVKFVPMVRNLQVPGVSGAAGALAGVDQGIEEVGAMLVQRGEVGAGDGETRHCKAFCFVLNWASMVWSPAFFTACVTFT